jgi:23S rRNA pseudouridine1911/1915/1917 synthase
MDDERNDLEYRLTAEDAGLKIREVLRRRLEVSARLLRSLKQGGGVALDGEPVRMNAKGRAGSSLAVRFPRESSHFEPEDIPISVIYEDRDLLVVDKQAGLVVHPTKGHSGHTVANGVMRHMLDRGDGYRIRFINRLDMDTTGLLLIGKNAYCQETFARQSAAGAVSKRYLAVVEGVVEAGEGDIDLPIGKADDGQIRRSVMEGGFPSVTHFRTLERFCAHSLLEIGLRTGRTHQIRVHLAHIGHPVLGDSLYGRPAPPLIGRQALHAAGLAFAHPRTKARVDAAAPLPGDMASLIEKLRLT